MTRPLHSTFNSIDLRCLHSNYRGDLWRANNLYSWKRWPNARSRSSKVAGYSTNQMNVCNFLLVITVTLVAYSIVSSIPPLIGWKSPIFHTPLSLNVDYQDNVFRNSEKNSTGSGSKVLHDADSKNFVIVLIKYRQARDRRTDKQTDIQGVPKKRIPSFILG